jgi:pyridoxal phosphate-dependent aminotransferase EpsN
MANLSPSKERIFLSAPHMGGREQDYVKQAFDTNWIAPLGENVDRFEQGLSSLCEELPVVALSSGTAALHLALQLVGVCAGDTVLCQSFTFCASANPIRYLGATPVFIASERKTWNISPEALEEAIRAQVAKGKRPKAIVIVHLYGRPALIDEILAVANKYDVPVVEDAAESLGSTYKGRPTGVFGRYGVLSFNGNKIITTSGGGALICPSKLEAEQAKHLATQARDPAPFYLHSQIGYNYRLSNVCAGIGRGQLEVLATRVLQKRAVFERYREILKSYAEIEFSPSGPDFVENRWLTTVTILPEVARNIDLIAVLAKLNSLNIECRPLWKPMHTQPVFADYEYFGDDVESGLFARGLCLPSSTSMKAEQQEFVADALVSTLGFKAR